MMFFSDTLYVDLAKHSDERVAQIKPLFQYWYDKAAWHRPCVIVLDNLDKVVSAELEVRSQLAIYFDI